MRRKIRKTRILIIQKRLPHYRKPFFEKLRLELEKNNIELELVYGVSQGSTGLRRDELHLTWGKEIKNREFKFGSLTLIWQPLTKELWKADLVIVEQSSKLILNYLLFFLYKLKLIRLCFWGHGKNFQENNRSFFGELIKRSMSREVFWWFAYTDLSASIVESIGYDKKKITVVQNTLDTREFINAYENADEEMLVILKKQWNIHSDNVCIFTGSMYPGKGISFILEACHIIKSLIHDFEMIFIGAGPDSIQVEKEASENPWIHYPGPLFGIEKVYYFKISKLLIMPGSVGLSIIDSFAYETPLVTKNVHSHGPEIEYLVSTINGIMWNDHLESKTFGMKVAELLKDDHSISTLKAGCRKAREKYTMEEMVLRFSNGIISALNSAKHKK